MNTRQTGRPRFRLSHLLLLVVVVGLVFGLVRRVYTIPIEDPARFSAAMEIICDPAQVELFTLGDPGEGYLRADGTWHEVDYHDDAPALGGPVVISTSQARELSELLRLRPFFSPFVSKSYGGHTTWRLRFKARDSLNVVDVDVNTGCGFMHIYGFEDFAHTQPIDHIEGELVQILQHIAAEANLPAVP